MFIRRQCVSHGQFAGERYDKESFRCLVGQIIMAQRDASNVLYFAGRTQQAKQSIRAAAPVELSGLALDALRVFPVARSE